MVAVNFDNDKNPKRIIFESDAWKLVIDKEGIVYKSEASKKESQFLIAGKYITTGDIEELVNQKLTPQEITKQVMLLKLDI
ncbi:hypothetical protein [Enterococcus sp. DIV0086]|uniref:hypothetical protein n=1 Tax=Enterococcus sp. DIV0086 TaxID=2774655 RepID=UPI003D28DFCA